MRKVALVAGHEAGAADPLGEELEAAREWLSALPIGRVSLHQHPREVTLEDTDVLWVRGRTAPDPRLSGWLAAGGRVLATHFGALLPAALALESRAPAPVECIDPVPPGFGLAGFGLHPLFAGLRDGAFLRPAPGRDARLLCAYDGARPARAGVVAVERRGLELLPHRVLAWEYAVGAGGVLCLAFQPSLRQDTADSRGEAEVVLANALLGEAVPHRDRAAAAALWPVPGRRATQGADLGAPPAAPSDPWPSGSSVPQDLAPAAAWTHAGRRVLVHGAPSSGSREVWVPPVRVMRDAAVRDAVACAPESLAADGVAGGLALGVHRLGERWLAAADVAVAVWEIGGPEGVALTLEWDTDLRRAWPYPAGSYGDLRYRVAGDLRTVRVESAVGPRAIFAASAGKLTAWDASAEAPAVRLRCTGATPLRIVAAAGVNEEELERSLHALERYGVAGLAAARVRRAEQLDRHGTALEAPDEALGRGFAYARERGDEALVGVPGVGRSLLAACPRPAGPAAWCFGAPAWSSAAAQLVAGNREPARELLKFLGLGQRPDGGIGGHAPLGGLASVPDVESTAAFLELAERVLAWTGDLEGLRRLRIPIASALAYLARRGAAGVTPSARMLDALEELVEGAPAEAALASLRRSASLAPPQAEVEAAAVLEVAAAALRRDAGALPASGAATALHGAVAALWGLEPDAPNAALALTPLLPSGWGRMALRRLRVGRTQLDLELRRRPGVLLLRVARLFGPRLVLTAGVRGAEVEAIEVDDVPLAGGRARFESHDRHEVRFLLRG